MKKQNKQNGITLVALVITIIILLILAGISIQAITNTGLFEKAGEAKKVSDIANIKEQIQLDIYEKQLNPPVGDITEGQLKTILEKYGEINYEEDGTTIKGITTKEEDEILLSDIYTGSIIKGLLMDKVQPGDYVAYTPDTASTDAILEELGSAYTGTNGNTSSTLEQEASLKWRVLDVEDGKVRLISEVPTTSIVALCGPNGYNNIVYLLDKTCKTLYSKTGYSEKVQNLKIEDIQNKMSIDYRTINSSVGEAVQGATVSPTGKVYPSMLMQEKDQTVTASDETTQPTTRLDLSEQTTLIGQTKVKTATSLTVKNTFWKKKMEETDFLNPIYYNLFINNGSEYEAYYLSSRCIAAYSQLALYCYSGVLSGYVAPTNLYNSANQYPDVRKDRLRPVITLNSNLKVKSGEGTSDVPYEIGL